ncbi:MAG: endonuclease/exonuclease/phosphatase family protein [Pirellulales bacterium]
MPSNSLHPIRVQNTIFALLACVTAGLGGGVRGAEPPATETVQVQPATELTLLTYNIHHGEGLDGKIDLPRIARVIQQANPDIVALQEVDRNTQRTGGVDQAAVLAELTHMQLAFGPNIELQGGQYGNAVLTRFHPVAEYNQRLPNANQGEQRGVLMVELDPAEVARGLTVLATHLDHRPDHIERNQSADTVNQLLDSQGSRPYLLLGDLNATWDSEPLTRLARHWSRLHGDGLLTSPTESPRRQIDYILVRPEHRWELIEARVIDEPIASDHRPLLMRLRIKLDDQPWYYRESDWQGFRRWHFRVAGREAYVVVPQTALQARPWVWRTSFPDFHAEMDVELLKQGYHVAYFEPSDLLGSPAAVDQGTRFHQFLVDQLHLRPRVVLEGVSRGGLLAYNWAAQHPDLVAAIYCDTPVCDVKSWPGGLGQGAGSPPDWQQCQDVYHLTADELKNFRGNPIDHAQVLAEHKIPLLHIVAEDDRIVPPDENTYLLRSRLESLGHRLDVISLPHGTPESHGHHFTHPDPQRVVKFVMEHGER